MFGPAPPLVLKLKRTVLKNVDDSAGRWQFTAGQVLRDKKHVGEYIGVKRVVFSATSPQNTASLAIHAPPGSSGVIHFYLMQTRLAPGTFG